MINPELGTIEKTLKEIAFPTRFAVELCADCNLACAMCHHPAMRRPKGKMPFELWRKCADEIAAIAPRTNCWFSFCGEPLLEPGLLLRVLAYGESVGLQSLNVNTNGMLLDRDVADAIVDSGVDLIVIGIDGLSKDVYERIRIGGDRDVVYRNVEYLLQARQAQSRSDLEIQVQFIEMDENEHEVEAYKAFWWERGATVKVRNKLSWGGKFDTPLHIDRAQRIPCPWALTMMHVFWDGRVPRCPGDTEGEEGVGNAWDDSLAALWRKLGCYRDLHLERRYDELPARCNDCKDWMTGAAQRLRPKATAPAAASACRSGCGSCSLAESCSTAGGAR